jgi:uncharacterized membrane protein
MGWNRWYVARSYLRSSLWIVPLIALFIEQIVVRLTSAYELPLDWIWFPQFSATSGGTIGEMDTVITLTVSFIVFTFGSMLVAIQVASGQLTPRIIATTLLPNNAIRFIVGLFVFTLLFAAGTKARVGTEKIPHFAVTVSVILGIASTTAFLFLIDYTARLLRPIAIIQHIGQQGMKVIETVYPKEVGEADLPTHGHSRPSGSGRNVKHKGKPGIVLAVNLDALMTKARRMDGIIELIPEVGDFIAPGEPLFRLYGGVAAVDDNRLRAQIAVGPERTIEQDSTFAFRVIVDVAIKALSKAINDPTTAVLAIDQLQRLLRLVEKRRLQKGALLDSDGKLRVIFPTPGWDDFVQLTFREIRLYGAENFQIARRLGAMIRDLMELLPVVRRPALQRELDLLNRALESSFPFPEDLALARQPDRQGLGGVGIS